MDGEFDPMEDDMEETEEDELNETGMHVDDESLPPEEDMITE